MRSLAALCVIGLAACPAPAPPAPARPAPPRPAPPSVAPVHAEPPRLVVLLVIDQLPAWAFEQKRPHLTRGFDRLLRDGEWHRGQHPSAATLTAPGHALLGSGEPTATSGILANRWWHRELGRVLTSVEGADGSIGAQHLRVPGLGDAIAAAGKGGKAVSLSLKDRAAILPLGHTGLPIWYDKTARRFITTGTPPRWLAAHDRAHPLAPLIAEVWTPLDAARLAELSGTVDDQRGEVGEKGFGTTFPHAPRATKDPADALFAVPNGNTAVLELAGSAIDGEQLGADAVPDLLVVSLSANDYVGHGWGHESWESWDMTLRLDQQLEGFLGVLDAKIGPDRWAMIVTSDHGAAPLPERSGGGRITAEQIEDAANRAASTQLGPGRWVVAAKFPSIYLSAAALKSKELPKVIHKIMLAVRSFPGIARVARTADFAGHCEQRTGEAFEICLSLDVERTGEILYLPKRGWILEDADEPAATAHGSLHDYDRVVPVIMLPPGRRPHAALAAPSTTTINMVRVATVLARWLGVTPPSTLARQR